MNINPYESPHERKGSQSSQASSSSHSLRIYGIMFLINVGIAMSFDKYFDSSKYLSNLLTDFYLKGEETPSFEGALVTQALIGYGVFYASFLIIPLLVTIFYCVARFCYRRVVTS